MANLSPLTFFFLFNIFLFSLLPNVVVAGANRKALDIKFPATYGGGPIYQPPQSQGCAINPPPPPPPPPMYSSPPPPPSQLPMYSSPSPPPYYYSSPTPPPYYYSSPSPPPYYYSSPPPPPYYYSSPSPPPYYYSSPPPPPSPQPVLYPSPPPPPKPFESERIEIAYNAIKKFKPRIVDDPLNITGSWKGNDVCKYRGFVCDKVPNYGVRGIAGVDFNNKLFGGPNLTLDGFIDELLDITFFHANSNNFTGGIPQLIGKLQYFFELDLSNNNFTGGFPGEVFGAKNLTFLDLRFNNYYGPVPASLFDMDIITAIFINNNKFSQNLPDNLGSTPARYLTFASNQFTGPIPKSIGTGKTRKNLIEVLFSNNKLSGFLAYEIGMLENAILFDASKNTLTGPIPYSFGCLAKMELLNLADNLFYGEVPEVICKLPELGNFTLRNNYFTQVGPECRDLIKKNILDVKGNCILGLPYQKSEDECNHFFSKIVLSEDKTRKWIPCKNNKYLHVKPSEDMNRPVKKVSPMRTYGTLVPH